MTYVISRIPSKYAKAWAKSLETLTCITVICPGQITSSPHLEGISIHKDDLTKTKKKYKKQKDQKALMNFSLFYLFF